MTMDKQAQDKLWNELSEESKNYILSKYNNLEPERCEADRDTKLDYEDLFGSHNLNPKPPTPKTWEDVVAQEECNFDTWLNKIQNAWFGYTICDKMIATAKIAKLIELGYGGMVSEEEWCNNDIEKWTIIWYPRSNTFDFVRINNNIHFITFHTLQQAEEFMSHESNKRLVKQYYMM